MATKDTTIGLNELIGLPPDVKVIEKVKHPHSYELKVKWSEPRPGERVCPFCGGAHCVVKDSGEWHTVRHTPCAGKPILITYHSPRYLCKSSSCGRSFYAKPDWVLQDMSVTRHLFFQIYDRLVSTTHAISSIGLETGTSAPIVNAVMNHIDLDSPSQPMK